MTIPDFNVVPPKQVKHTYELCKKCAKKGAYLYTPHVQRERKAVKGTPVEYCKYCNPRTGVTRVVVKTGMFASLRKLFAG